MKTEQAGNDTQIKGNQAKGASCPEKEKKNWQYFCLHAVFGCSII